ncbi:hypothetical protein [Elizabethkingia meningoseptica]|nr:hypothetical protein [Elizabethkingia meningoseptica]
MKNKETKNQCPEFPHFGASYPDATCIDGYLWDLDKCDENGLYGGGDDPCPFCNKDEYIEWIRDEDFTREDAEKRIESLKKVYDK